MKSLFSLLALAAALFASAELADTASCKKCHPTITAEFEKSMHKNASIYNDKVHKAIWDKHPAKAKGNYKCAKCHTPNAKNEEEQHDGITCLSCHTISNVEKHAQSNKNVYSTKVKTFFSAEKGRETEIVKYKTTTSWFGMNKTTVGSAYHDIDYTNEQFYTGEMCMGCHSHKQNSKKFAVCETAKAGAKNTQVNCISCHMPRIDGTATTVRHSAQHAYHGFAGTHVSPKMLSKYIELSYVKESGGFNVAIDNQAPHDLMSHPLRVVQLRVIHTRNGIHTNLKTQTFVRVIGHEGKPAMPWLATEVIKDTMIKANEKRLVSFDKELKSGDQLEVVLGFYIVNPKVLKKLGLDNEKDLKEFTVLQNKNFNIK